MPPPKIPRVGCVFSSIRTSKKATEVAAQRLGVALEAVEVRGPEDFEAAFATAKQRNAQALLTFSKQRPTSHSFCDLRLAYPRHGDLWLSP
jgi:hypothetical protein